MPPDLTTVIRTHNPNLTRLRRVLEGLRSQTLSAEKWELVIVDNRSSPQIAASDLPELPPRTRIVREETPGSAYAYARGFVEAAADLVVYIDDDTVPAADYLERSLAIGKSSPHLGAWGAALIQPEFDQTPPGYAKPYFKYLALREDSGDRWSNNPKDVSCIPFGPGLSVRRPVGISYGNVLANDRRRSLMGKIGKGLGASEDLDLALTAVDAGMGFGVFSSLRITHLIPPRRLTREYLDQLVFDIERSEQILLAVRGLQSGKPGRLDAAIFWLRAFRADSETRRLMLTRRRGHDAGAAAIREAIAAGHSFELDPQDRPSLD